MAVQEQSKGAPCHAPQPKRIQLALFFIPGTSCFVWELFDGLTEYTTDHRFWEKLKQLTGIKFPRLNPRTWTRDLLDSANRKPGDREIILCGMWSLWNSRNDRRHGKSPIEPGLAVDWAIEPVSVSPLAAETWLKEGGYKRSGQHLRKEL